MNREYRAKLQARSDRYHATEAQIIYLRRLLDEAFAHCYSGPSTCYDRHHLDRVTRSEASAAIANLLNVKAKGWK